MDKKVVIETLTEVLEKESLEIRNLNVSCGQVEGEGGCGYVHRGLNGEMLIEIEVYDGDKDESEEFMRDPEMRNVRQISVTRRQPDSVGWMEGI